MLMAALLQPSASYPSTLRHLRSQLEWRSTFFPHHHIQPNVVRLIQHGANAVSRRIDSENSVQDAADDKSSRKKPKSSRKTSKRSRKNESTITDEQNTADAISVVVGNTESSSSSPDEAENTINLTPGDKNTDSLLTEVPKEAKRTRKKKATSLPTSDNDSAQKKVSRKSSKKAESSDEIISDGGIHSIKDEETMEVADRVRKLLKEKDDEQDISSTYSWPPLVCCYGSAQHLFIPSGRPANRLRDYKIHDAMKDALWSPDRFVRAPGGPSSSVALALAAIGGRVAFMGKLGNDGYGQCLLYHLNLHGVQTRAVKLDDVNPTSLSYMKISRRGSIKATCVKPCAEDSFRSSDINIDVLKEAEMFYFNSSALLDPNARLTLMDSIEISKKFGSTVFFDLNLPLPLWESSKETKSQIQQAWNAADFIEVTKQELEFLCGIKPSEKFDTKDNDRSKFIHHKREVVQQLWHENLKVLFVTNGTSKIHYYTTENMGSVLGMEEPPITPFTCDMSVSGDAIVAALMRMLTVQPHLATDKDYLEHMIKYAISCGVIDQWLLARIRGYPLRAKLETADPEQERVMLISEKEYRTVGDLVS